MNQVKPIQRNFILLFACQIIETMITNTYNPQTHLLLQQVTESSAKIIKNSQQLFQLFKTIHESGLIPVAYTSKKHEKMRTILSKIYDKLDWIFVQIDQEKYPHVHSNNAFMRDGMIRYGKGFSTAQSKEEIRMAIHSGLNIFQKARFIIIEKTTQEIEKLKKQGYKNTLLAIPTPQELQRLLHEQNQQLATQAEEQLEGSENLQKILQKSVLILNDKTFISTKYKLPIRPFNSTGICCIIFRNNNDSQLYIAKSELPIKIGGDQYYTVQQNKIVCIAISQILGCSVLPHYLIPLLMKHSLISQYEGKKAVFFVRKYAKKLKKISQMQISSIKQLLFEGLLKGKKVKDFGKSVLLSLLFGEELKAKGLLQNLSVYKSGKDWRCCRIGFYSTFSEEDKQWQYVNFTNCIEKIKIEELHEGYWKQIHQFIGQIKSKATLLKGILENHWWKQDKRNLCKAFYERLSAFQRAFQHKLSPPTSTKLRLETFHLKYLVNSNYDLFTKQEISYFQNTPQESRYLQHIKQPYNFMIYANIFPVNKFLKWIHDFHPNVVYISLLTSQTSSYTSQAKEAKLQKRKTLFVVDHCQRDQSEEEKVISTINMGQKTVFIYRLKRSPNRNISQIEYRINSSVKLQKSEDEIFQAIFANLQTTNRYEFYDRSLELWIKNNCEQYDLDEDKVFSYCKNLYLDMIKKRNRIIHHQTISLYALPIYIEKQRIYFIHDINDFLHVKYLYEDILNGNWDGKLLENQLKCFQEWCQFLPNANKIKEELIDRLKTVAYEERYDYLELLKCLKVKNLFAKLQKIINYPSIKMLQADSKHFYVLTQEGKLQVNSWEQTENYPPLEPFVSRIQTIEGKAYLTEGNLVKQLKNQELIKIKQLQNNEIFTLNNYNVIDENKMINIMKENSTVYKTEYSYYKVISLNMMIIATPELLLRISIQNEQIKIKNLLKIPAQNQPQISLLYNSDGSISSFFYSYIQDRKNLIMHEFQQIQLDFSHTGSYKFTHKNKVKCKGFNISSREVYTIEELDDSVLVWKMGEGKEKDMPDHKYYMTQKTGKRMVGKGGSLLILSDYNYVKKVKLM